MRVVLEAFSVGHHVHVPASCFGRNVGVNMKVRALIVCQLIPLPLCDSTIPRWHTHGLDRQIYRGNIRFESDDFKGRVFCFIWEYKPLLWCYQWYQLTHPKQGRYLAHPLKDLRSQVVGAVQSFVVFEPERV